MNRQGRSHQICSQSKTQDKQLPIQKDTLINTLPSIQAPQDSCSQDAIAYEAVEGEAKQSTFSRRHDLDALRAIAMLLGIVLHGALSFAPIPWSVADSQQSQGFYVLFAFLHGFRMPLFFVLSGFFTAMLWRKRGLQSLVKHRFFRIFLPLVIGCFTIIPVMWGVGFFVSVKPNEESEASSLYSAVVSGDVEKVRSELEVDTDINARDPASGATPLCTSIFIGHTEVTKLLLDAGADVDVPDRNRSTPLHIAVFMGRAKEVAMLLDAGVDTTVRDGSNQLPRDLLSTDYGTTNFIASALGVSVDEEELKAGRKEIAGLLKEEQYLGAAASGSASPINLEGLKGLLFQFPIFMHLWFLAFLCWLIVAFLFYALLAQVLNPQKLPRWLICSPINLLWLVPLTMAPQAFMVPSSFGPDASIGLLPIPSVLLYYAIFFFFGAIYWDMNDAQGKLGKWWYVSLPIAILIVFPVALDFVSGDVGIIPSGMEKETLDLLGNFTQALFAWLMISGSIGLFRTVASGESKWMRYISDSSYWLYLSHLPLIILAQWFVRDMPIPAILKFVGITVLTTGFLLLTYEYLVRYTLIGRLLNGPRTRPPKETKHVTPQAS